MILLGKFAISVVNLIQTIRCMHAKQLTEPKLLFKRCPLVALLFNIPVLKASEFDQEIPQSHIAAQPTALCGRDKEHEQS